MKAVGLAVRTAGTADIRPLVPLQPKPAQILEDALLEFLLGPLRIGVLDAQDERAVVAAREQPVEQRGARVADVQLAGGAWREADSHLSAGAPPRTPAPSLPSLDAARDAPSASRGAGAPAPPPGPPRARRARPARPSLPGLTGCSSATRRRGRQSPL